MVFTIDFINNRFNKFNQLIFKGKLPPIPVKLSQSKSTLGTFNTKYMRQWDGSRNVVSRHFLFSRCFDLDERILEDVILHEMIHYFISYNNYTDTSPHGQLFRSMMEKINTEFGRNITISTKTLAHQIVGSTNKKWRVIAVMQVSDGSIGIKVLPKIAERIAYYYNEVCKSPTIKSIKIYFHNSSFFSNYPSSVALKFHQVDEFILRKELVGAQLIQVKGGKVNVGEKYNGEDLF